MQFITHPSLPLIGEAEMGRKCKTYEEKKSE
jgi:hypothetical protein